MKLKHQERDWWEAGKEGETKGGRGESERVGSKRDIRKSERKEREGEEKWTVYTDQRVS